MWGVLLWKVNFNRIVPLEGGLICVYFISFLLLLRYPLIITGLLE